MGYIRKGIFKIYVKSNRYIKKKNITSMNCLDIGVETMPFWVTFQIDVRQTLDDAAAFVMYTMIGSLNKRLNNNQKMTKT